MGFSIEFSLQTFSDFFAQVTKFKKKKDLCDNEIKSLLSKTRSRFPWNRLPPLSWVPFFVIPKTGDKFRPVHNLKNSNKFVRYQLFKWKGIQCLNMEKSVGDPTQEIDFGPWVLQSGPIGFQLFRPRRSDIFGIPSSDRLERLETVACGFFAKIASTWELTVDLFASACIAQLNQFVSWFPHPDA